RLGESRCRLCTEYVRLSTAFSEINSLVISDVIIENGNYLLQEYFCQTGQSASAICHPERSRKSDATADDADLGLAKTRNCPVLQLRCNPPLLFCYARKDGEYPLAYAIKNSLLEKNYSIQCKCQRTKEGNNGK
ncbi:MAG: hypothetical protein IKL95_01875, partial [Alphaproteobacteria bacterium]|nr:hypothetical protein [Alphaproteobacteria bacterium]